MYGSDGLDDSSCNLAPEYQDDMPLTTNASENGADNQKQAGTNCATFNLKEQLRLDTGIKSKDNSGVISMSFA